MQKRKITADNADRSICFNEELTAGGTGKLKLDCWQRFHISDLDLGTCQAAAYAVLLHPIERHLRHGL